MNKSILSLEKQSLIISKKNQGLSAYQISKETEISRNTVLKYMENDGFIIEREVTRKLGRKRSLTRKEKSNIKKYTKNKKIRSSKKIKEDLKLEVSVRTIQRTLRDLNFQYKRLKSKPILSISHKQKRMDFAKQYLSLGKKWKKVFFSDGKKVFFSDEKKFNLDGPDGVNYFWFSLENDQNFSYSTIGNPKKGIIVWGAFSYNFKAPLFFIEELFNSDKYCSMICDHFLPYAHSCFGEYFIFQQDNAPIHVSQFSKEEFDTMKIKTIEWPPNSPDLNPMENAWSLLVNLVYSEKSSFSSINELKNAIIDSWDKIEQKTLKKLVLSMEDRMIKVIKEDGGSVNY